MSQKTVHSCVRQENQCRIPLSFLGALVTSRIMNLFYISPFSELPLWLRHRDCHHAPTQRAGVCPRAAARIRQRLFPGAQPQCGARLSMGCGAGGAQTLPVSQAVHGVWGRGCSDPPGVPVCSHVLQLCPPPPGPGRGAAPRRNEELLLQGHPLL